MAEELPVDDQQVVVTETVDETVSEESTDSGSLGEEASTEEEVSSEDVAEEAVEEVTEPAAEEVAPPVDPDHDVRRLAGKDRYGTNLAVNEALGYAKGGTVIVATGANYADALSAAPAAASRDGALFLTSKGSLSSATLAEIKKLEPRRVYVIGGTGAISSKVVTQLRDATDVFPLRLAGADRYETSAKVFQHFFSGSTVPTAFVATGQDFPDALSASAAAGALGGPVLLVNGTTGKNLMSESTALLKRLGTENILITGGQGAVNSTIEANLSKAFPNVERLQGKDRYATNMAVNVYLNKHAGSVPMTGVWIATGKNFPDALTAAPAAGDMTQRLVLTNGVCIPKPVVSKWINGPGSQVEMTTLVGGLGVLPEALMALPECGGTVGTTTEVTLLNINDFHGRIDGTLNADDSALTASSTVNFGYTVDSLRNAAGWDNSLFLSAGDNVGATLFASALAQDQPTIDLLNALGLEASAVGNHEFDAGWADLRDRLTSEFNGVLLGANVYKEGTTRPLLPEYAMLDAAGLKVAVIGVVTEDTPTLVNPANVAGVTFGDPVEAVQRVAAKLEALPLAERPDVIVAEYHEGAAGVNADTTLESKIAAGGIFAKIALDTPASVDVIFNGHTHQEYTWNGPIPGTDGTRPIVSTGSYGANVGNVVLTVDTATSTVDSYTMELVNTKSFAAGTTIDSMIAASPVLAEVYGITLEALQVAKIEGEVPVGQITQTLSRDYTKGVYVEGKWQKGDSGAANNRDGESPMGTLVGNMLRDGQMAQLPKAPDFGVTNPGGLRTDFDYGTDGVLTVAEARAVLPFNNNLSVVEMTGEQIVTMLEQQWQRDAAGNVPSRSYLQLGLSDNVSYTYHEIDDPAQPGFKLGVIDSVTIDGVALDPAATYNVGTFEFLAAGGDNFWVFKEGVVTDTGLVDWESWLAYLSAASGKTGDVFTSPIAPDYTRRGVAVEGLPETFGYGDEVTLTFRNMDVHAVGAPANTKLDVTLGGVSVGSFDITNEMLANGNWTDKAVVTFTVPADVPAEGELVATAAPTGTEVVIPYKAGLGAGKTELTLLNINDFHGRIDGTLNADDSALTGSLTMDFAYTVDSLRNDAGWDNSLFLSAGDNVGATLFASALAKDQPTIDILNSLGLEASAVGNHEFDAGWADIEGRLTSEFDGVLLGANVYKKDTTTPALPEYAMLDAAGLKVAVIGVVTEDTPTLVNPANVAGVSFGDPVAAVQRVAAKLEALPEAERPDVIVAEYHEGAAGVNADTTLESKIAAGGIFAKIALDTPASVDVIFNGHTHQEYTWNGPIPGTDGTRPIVSTGSYGANVGNVVLTVDTATSTVDSYTMELVNTKSFAAGTTIDSMIAASPVLAEVYGITLEALQVAKIEGEVPVGQITQTLSRDYTKGVYVEGKWQKGDSGAANNRDGESPMGTLVGNMLRDGQMAQLPKAPDFGVTNPGGLRTDFDYGTDGVLTVAEARAVLPFNNNLSVVEMTGEQIVTMLEQQWQRDAAGNVPSRSYLQLGLSDNVSYTYHEIDDPAQPGFKLGVIDSVTIDGVALDPAATYNVGTFEFLAAGGDNFWVFKEGVVTDTGLVDWESWLAYLSAASGKTEEGAAVTFSTPIAPDFARRGVAVEGVPADGFVAGEEVTLTFRNMDVHAVGAPANTKLDVTLGGVPVGSFDITNEMLANGNWTDKAVVTFTVPAGYTEGALVATAVPTNTEAVIY
ncbi:5'-nucleotidase C-terminal domain-containing protein [Actinomyces minihominis]|uniref:5'-nucleotidase C-terminal domain-containing protein n=1 Tax=Actinomyces minihominis TaxID=2002838 RepID=UPI0013EA1268|nr:5'-nucleotidase C-terminal domain-containing protein [Actinomyces minihominis]